MLVCELGSPQIKFHKQTPPFPPPALALQKKPETETEAHSTQRCEISISSFLLSSLRCMKFCRKSGCRCVLLIDIDIDIHLDIAECPDLRISPPLEISVGR